MAPVVKASTPETAKRHILVVDDEPNLVELIEDVVRGSTDCGVVVAASLDQARKILATAKIALLVTDVNLPDGDGMSLIPTLHKHQPGASAIVMTGAPSMDGAISALRGGALDFVPKPFTHDQLVDRIRKALDQQARAAKEEKRFDRLREAVKRLNASRRTISKKVDLLCNDLVSAYGELSRQLDGIRTQEGFRKFVASAKDLEQLLCHAMDWLLRQIGYANVAVWLAGEDGEFQLGAYMKYTVAGEAALTEALRRVLLPMAVRDGLLRVSTEEIADKFTPQEMHHLKDQDVIAVNCTYLGESLAALVFFRDVRAPFTQEDEALLKSISPIFALSLASVVRDADAEDPEDSGNSPFYDGNTDVEDDDEKPKRNDSADWWKHGGEPPF